MSVEHEAVRPQGIPVAVPHQHRLGQIVPVGAVGKGRVVVALHPADLVARPLDMAGFDKREPTRCALQVFHS